MGHEKTGSNPREQFYRVDGVGECTRDALSLPERASRSLTRSYYPERSGVILAVMVDWQVSDIGSESPSHRWQGCKLSRVGILLAQRLTVAVPVEGREMGDD
jgi:hypothetical protein